MTITPDTTLAELGASMKERGLSLRICHLGTGFCAFVRGSEREGFGYGRDLPEAVQMAEQDHAAPRQMSVQA
jgi:hypothetical protein